ncbi:outer membrane beta-barrel protein [Fulvivirga ulvae]|uniref:outer membrane beta-barrel protein n=1 Tax=Fulvivirga ulvae TaxID=2904245 RepID=UPI002107DF5F|nr:outer membrane beta-barrel protein [Fulvivirga ulvae]
MDTRGRFQFGLKAGINYSNVYDTKGEKFVADPKFGIAMGVFLAIPVGETIGIQPEVQFSQKGFKATGMILGASTL